MMSLHRTDTCQQTSEWFVKGQQYYDFTIGSVVYQTKITHLIGCDPDDSETTISNIYLMSPVENKMDNRCIWVMIMRNDSHVAELAEVTKDFPRTTK